MSDQLSLGWLTDPMTDWQKDLTLAISALVLIVVLAVGVALWG